MDEVRKLILETAQELGLDLKELSLKLGKNHAYLQQYVKRGSPKRLHADDRAALAKLLHLPETALGAPDVNHTSPLQTYIPNATITSQTVGVGPDIPLYGTVVGGVDGQFELNGNILDRIPGPPSLFGIRNAYAVRVVGESMDPRYQDGETVFVNPDRRPVRDDYVVAQIRVEELGAPLAYIKRLVRWNSEKLVLTQHNPVKELVFDGKSVVSVHYILRNGE